MNPEIVAELSDKLVAFLETGAVPDGLLHPDVFLDLSLPTWRIQTEGIEELVRVRKEGHPGPGKVTHSRTDPTPTGFMLEFEERWEQDGQSWYAREMLRTNVANGRITQLTVYCTGDWDPARQQEHATTVTLLRR